MNARKPLRILIAADTYPPDVNGAAVFSSRLATQMSQRGHEVHIAAARNGPGPQCIETRPEATVHRFRSFKAPTHEYYRLCLPWQVEPAMKRLIGQIRPDVVHVQCHYMIGRAAILAAEQMRIRLIATNHFMPENLDPFLPFPQWFRKIVSKNSWRDMADLMGRASVITTPTPLAAETMKRQAGFDEVIALSNGIDVEYYTAQPGEAVARPAAPTVLFVGRLAVEKNVDVLIDAIHRTDPALQIHAHIIGDGEQRDHLRAQIQQLDLENRVHLLGHADEAQLRQAYLRADVFCQPGTAELQSLVSLEAMSAGKPVVLANALALPHLVTEGKNGALFTPGDATDLAQKLNAIFAAPEAERLAMGKASRRLAEQHDIAVTMGAYEDLYYGADTLGEVRFPE